MAYTGIKAFINSIFYNNGANEIEGDTSATVFESMVDSLSEFEYKGNIIPTSPLPSVADLDRKLMYTASTNGTYVYYGGFVLDNELAIITWNGTSWAKNKLITIPSSEPYSYTSQSFTDSTSIIVNHNFGVYPVVNVYDENGYLVEPYSVQSTNSQTATVVTFTEAYSGVVSITCGSPSTANPYVIVANNYTLQDTDETVEVYIGNIIITLPTAVGNLGKAFTVINTSEDPITVNTTSSQTIGNSSPDTDTSLIIYAGEVLTFVSNNINYRIK